MNLTGSIGAITVPLSTDMFGSLLPDPTGSSAIDTVITTVLGLPNLILSVAGLAGGDIGSTPPGPIV